MDDSVPMYCPNPTCEREQVETWEAEEVLHPVDGHLVTYTCPDCRTPLDSLRSEKAARATGLAGLPGQPAALWSDPAFALRAYDRIPEDVRQQVEASILDYLVRNGVDPEDARQQVERARGDEFRSKESATRVD